MITGCMGRVLLVALVAWGAQAQAQVVLRMASPAPDGSAWARELMAFTREVEIATRGAVRLKWYLGGIAGGEVESGERMQRGQLDGVAGGGMLCQRHAPSMRVMRARGLFLDREEASYVRDRLKPVFDAELKRAGYELLATADLGADIVLSRQPLRTLDEVRRARLWRWDLDDVGALIDAEMGLHPVPMPLDAAGHAYDQGTVDGFLTIPSATLAFQWHSRARYLLELPMGHVWACLIVTRKAYDRIPFEHQQALRAASAKIASRLNDVGGAMDKALLGGLFEKNGLRRVPISEAMRKEFYALARQAREKLGAKIVSDELMAKVQGLLADLRAERLRR
jgi:TRAP-type transport system periplasmic protein